MHLDRTTRRILGSLIEKRYSTPDQYPLTLNALVLACNQKSNRDPEMQLEDFLVEGCLRQLRIDGWLTVVEREYGRSVRYSERMVEKLGLTDKEAAILAELMLRGPQTEQELPRRCERMAKIASPEEALAILQTMAGRGLVQHLPRDVGQRLARWKHLLTPPAEAEAAPAAAHGAGAHAAYVPTHVQPTSQAHVPAPSFAAPHPMSSLAAPPLVQEPAHAVQPLPAGAAEVAALRSCIVTLKAEIDRLAERVARLESR